MRFTTSRLGRVLTPALKSIGVNKLIVLLRGANKKKGSFVETEKPTRQERETLMEMYDDDIKELEKYIGRTLGVWRNHETNC